MSRGAPNGNVTPLIINPKFFECLVGQWFMFSSFGLPEVPAKFGVSKSPRSRDMTFVTVFTTSMNPPNCQHL